MDSSTIEYALMLYLFCPGFITLPRVLDFSPYSAVLLDLDGTLYHEDEPLPGAVELVQRLQAEQKPFACVSNSTASPIQLTMRLAGMGIEIDPDQIYTAAAAAADYLVQHFPIALEGNGHPVDRTLPRPRPRVFNLASEGINDMLDGLVEWSQVAEEPCDAVIAGAVTNSYATDERQRIALQLLRHGAHLIGICADRVYPSPRGIEFGSGALSWMLGYAANVRPIFCGKPEAIFFGELCMRLKVEPHNCVLIGDNLEADIHGAKVLGMATVLTLTGITRGADLPLLPEDLRPDLVINDLTEA